MKQEKSAQKLEVGQRVWWHTSPYEPSYSVDEISTGIIKKINVRPPGSYDSDFLLVGEPTGYDSYDANDEYLPGHYVSKNEAYTNRSEIFHLWAKEAWAYGEQLLERSQYLEKEANKE